MHVNNKMKRMQGKNVADTEERLKLMNENLLEDVENNKKHFLATLKHYGLSNFLYLAAEAQAEYVRMAEMVTQLQPLKKVLPAMQIKFRNAMAAKQAADQIISELQTSCEKSGVFDRL